MVKIGTAFLLVTDTAVSSPRHAETFGLTPVSRDEWSAVMADDPAGATLTLLASASGIAAQPGLPWATHNIMVDDLEQLHGELAARASPAARSAETRGCAAGSLSPTQTATHCWSAIARQGTATSAVMVCDGVGRWEQIGSSVPL